MRKFADVRLVWDNRTYTVRANQLLGLIARLEGIVTFVELVGIQVRGGVPQAKLAQAYGEALRYAGCEVEDEDIYYKMFPTVGQPAETALAVSNSVNGLMALMIPPDNLAVEAKTVGNEEAVKSEAS